jgi:ribosome-associated toxin RatA of RatAB toxin-antitoxin module
LAAATRVRYVRAVPRAASWSASCALFVLLAITATCVAPEASARSDLSASERAHLAAGGTVIEESVVERDGRRFVGGVAYRIVDADVSRLSTIVRDPRRYRELFPHLAEARLLSIDERGQAKIRFDHANGPFHAGYVARVSFSDRGRAGRFRIDRGAPSSLQDGWGFVRLTELPGHRTLVTFGVLFDLGGGLVRLLFEKKIQRAALGFPDRLADAARR